MAFSTVPVGALLAEDLLLLRTVHGRIACEPWMRKDPAATKELATYMVKMYMRGMRDPEKLYSLCLAAARDKFSVQDPQSPGDQTTYGA